MKGFILGLKVLGILGLFLVCAPLVSQARDLEYEDSEVSVYVTPGEPTQVQFPDKIVGGFKKKISDVNLDRRDRDLILFASDSISDSGEAIIVRTDNGRSYSLRIRRATAENPRDDSVKIEDSRRAAIFEDGSEEPGSVAEPKKYDFAPASTVSGLMREMVLAAEFGKSKVPGYKVSTQYSGETVLHDGTIETKIDRIFIGPNLWGYVLTTENLLDQGQIINPATFRLDGTRAVSATRWELAPRPMNAEEQLAAKHQAKVYVITRAKAKE